MKRLNVKGRGLILSFAVFIPPVLWAEKGGRAGFTFLDFLKLTRVWLGVAFALLGLVLLIKVKLKNWIRALMTLVIFVVFGVLTIFPLGSFSRGLGLHPSPVCAVTRPFQFLSFGRGVPTFFLWIVGFMALLTVLVNKSFCGWVCPLGAIQEFLYRLQSKYKLRIPFKVTNSVRVLLFLVFLLVVALTRRSIYDYFNPFEFFHWRFETIAVIAFSLFILLGIFVFRPFCYLVCPFGLISWVLEHLSILRVRVDSDKCTMCGICVKKSPCTAVSSIIERKKTRPDCHACGTCITLCPFNALKFK